jgi:TRAP-type C4-dicarboxylate transport system permease large subunit
LNDVIIGALPFVVTMVVMIILLVLFPEIALWMPKTFG